MKLSKPNETSLLLEAKELKSFTLNSMVDLKETEDFNKLYKGFILLARQPGMQNSIQLFAGNDATMVTLVASALESLLCNDILTDKQFKHITKMILKNAKGGK